MKNIFISLVLSIGISAIMFGIAEKRVQLLEARFRKIDEDEEKMAEVRRQGYIELSKATLSLSQGMLDDYDRLCKQVERDKAEEPMRKKERDEFNAAYEQFKASEKGLKK